MKTTPTQNSTKRAFSYLRWSTPEQQLGDSERRQLEAAKNYCTGNGLQLCDTVTDRGISAFHGLNREIGLKKLSTVMKSGDVLIVEDTDRLSRQGWLETSILLNSFLQRGIEVVTLRNGAKIDRESFARNPGIFMPIIFGGHLGNEESVKKSYRIRESWNAKKQAVANGKAARHKFWAWLKWDADSDKPVLVPEKAAIVRRIYGWAMQGYGALAIARLLKEESVRPITKRAGNWSSDYVHRILTNKAAIGWYTHVDPPRPGIYPPVIDEATFYAVQELVKSRGQNKGATVRASAETSNLFTKIAVCKSCGSPLTMHRQQARGKNYAYLVCSGSRRSVGNCGMASVRYDRFEASVLEILSAVDKLRSQMQEKSGPSQGDVLAARLRELEQQGEKMLRLIEDDMNPPVRLVNRMKELQADENKVREELDREKAKHSASASGATWGQFRKLLPEQVSNRDFRLRLRTALRAVMETVTVDLPGKKFELRLKDYTAPITAELEGGNLHYVVTNGKDKALGCCCPLSARWTVGC